MNDFNSQIVDEFRSTNGVVGGHFEGKHLALVHVIGRKSGTERIYPLVYTTDGDAILVCGSMGGAPQEPQWVANLEAQSEVTVEIPGQTLTTKPTVLRGGAERARLYQKLADYWPDMWEYEQNSTRRFPVIRLDPIG
ncbi:MAG TPA: nitroreductase/quinone reductase family protein [Pseudonocardiaceae bacterium]|jgi:deazaflavin-dependent oxidoreductase (nitroreductase family)|nr:nitroreductase/quinone reductase family protein [Pseudonocardiaceae bacterium]